MASGRAGSRSENRRSTSPLQYSPTSGSTNSKQHSEASPAQKRRISPNRRRGALINISDGDGSPTHGTVERGDRSSPTRAGFSTEQDWGTSPIEEQGTESNQIPWSPISLKNPRRSIVTPRSAKSTTRSSPSLPRRACSARARMNMEYKRAASPQRRLHFPTRWTAKSEMTRPSSTKSFHQHRQASPVHRQTPELEPNPYQPKLLDSLGLAPIASDLGLHHESLDLPTCLPSFAPKQLQQCDENCYWHWLVYSLLGDVNELRQSLEDTEDEVKRRAEQRRQAEQLIGNRDQLVDDLETMEESLEILRVEVPSRKRELETLENELYQWQQKHREILEKQEEVKDAIRQSKEWQNVNGAIVKDAERDAEVIQIEERLLKDHLNTVSEEFNKVEKESLELGEQRDALRREVDLLEEAKNGGKKPKAPGIGKSKSKALKKR